MTLMFPKSPALRDPKYLRIWLPKQACVVSSSYATDDMDVVGAHIRTKKSWERGVFGNNFGMGMKPPDDRALPVRVDLHNEQHRIGEVPFWRDAILLNDQLCIEALIALDQEKTPGSQWTPEGNLDHWRDQMNDAVMMDALIAMAQKRYREWQDG